jgi:hypothetical protein
VSYFVRPLERHVRVDASHRSWQVCDASGLHDVLTWRDKRGGARFWLSEGLEQYPVLAITVTGELADVMFYPEESHPGFRCLGGQGLPKGGSTTFVFDGCDPWTGEDSPNEFVVSLNSASLIAVEFLEKKQMSVAVSWLEL